MKCCSLHTKGFVEFHDSSCSSTALFFFHICLWQKQTETQRQKTVSEFQQVRQLVEEKQRFLLTQLDEINKDILKRQNNYIARITEEISRLDHLISELEGKCQQPASEFLQDVRSTLSMYEAPSHSPLFATVLEGAWTLGPDLQRTSQVPGASTWLLLTLPPSCRLWKGFGQQGPNLYPSECAARCSLGLSKAEWHVQLN
nr:E3 ubiquitin-protein ligase TRIM11-like [Chrysemys picta bellii]